MVVNEVKPVILPAGAPETRRKGPAGFSSGALPPGQSGCPGAPISEVLGQSSGLVVDVGGHLGQSVRVFPGVVGAEQEGAGIQLDPDVGLRAAGITAILGGQGGEIGLSAHISM